MHQSQTEVIIHTSAAAFTVFSTGNKNSLQLVEHVPIVKESLKLLASNEWLSEEKSLISKYAGKAKLYFLGFKNEKLNNVIVTQDINKLASVTEAIKENKDFLYSLRTAAIRIAKKKVSASVSFDNLIIQAKASAAELAKSANLLTMRLREWFELYCPEFSSAVTDNERFVAAILSSGKEQLLEQLNMKPEESMGAPLSDFDAQQILASAAAVSKLYETISAMDKYIETLMRKHCQNLAAVAGSQIGAELLRLAGSLEHLAMMPASTIQLLGAEKALFRHLKDRRQRPPKYGVLHEHELVAAAKKDVKGKIARLLADKISIAVKIDFFKGSFAGDKLRAEVERKVGQLRQNEAAV